MLFEFFIFELSLYLIVYVCVVVKISFIMVLDFWLCLYELKFYLIFKLRVWWIWYLEIFFIRIVCFWFVFWDLFKSCFGSWRKWVGMRGFFDFEFYVLFLCVIVLIWLEFLRKIEKEFVCIYVIECRCLLLF